MLKTNLPVLIVKNIVLFPYSEIRLELDNLNDKKVVSLAESYFDNYILIINTDKKDRNLFPRIGVLGQLKLKIDMPNGQTKVVIKGITRCEVTNYNLEDGTYDAYINNVLNEVIDPIEELASVRSINKLLNQYVDNKKGLGNSILGKVENVNSISKLTDVVAVFLPIAYQRQVNYIMETKSLERVKMVIDDLNYELSITRLEQELESEVNKNLEISQKEFLLKEKLKVINKELGNEETDVKLLETRLSKLDCPIKVKERLSEEINRYKLCNSNSPEIGILRNYIDTLLGLPWNINTTDNNDIESIRTSLNNSHYGLDDAKERIIEYIAASKHTSKQNSPIICLVGPPGIGKTSLAKAISTALNRKFVKISVGGINDEAELTGHMRAYVGAIPGKIISSIKRVGVNNPVFIIDEIDKMTKDIKGDPASSLLEVLDKEQNDKFIDHFVEEEFDLSKVMFILTANYIDKIPNELRDRLEIIELNGYTELEKQSIAHNYIIKKLMNEFDLDEKEFNIKDTTIFDIIRFYTRESGVRELERLLARICRKIICAKLLNKKIDVNKDLVQLLGREKYAHENNYDNTVGVCNGLTYTSYGGDIIKIETINYPGTGCLSTTGQLGDVLAESIQIGMNYLKSNYRKFHIELNALKKNDFHVHIPKGSIKKDGPSAGVTIITSMLSLLKDIKISKDIAMTGEVTLTGKVLAVGGLKEKITGALSNDIKLLYLPSDNKIEIEELKSIYDNKLKIKMVDNYMEIYNDLLKEKE